MRAAMVALVAAAAALGAWASAAPPAHGAEQLLEVVNVPATGARAQSNLVLQQGRQYRVVVNGTAEVSYPDGRKELFDALFCYSSSGGVPIPGDDCLDMPPVFKPQPLYLDIGGGTGLTVDALNGTPLPYNASHEYQASFVASATGALGARLRSFLNGTGAGAYIITIFGEPAPAPGGGGAAPGGGSAPAVPPGSVLGQPPIIGPPLFRVVAISPTAREESHFSTAVNAPRPPIPLQVGFVLGEGDSIRVIGGVFQPASVTLQTLPSGAIFTIYGSVVTENGRSRATSGWFQASSTPTLFDGRATIRSAPAGARAQSLAANPDALLTPLARVDASGGVAQVAHDPRRGRTTVGNERGTVSVTPANRTLRGLRLTPGRQVEVTSRGAGRPFPLVPDLETTIPKPREVRAGPAIVTGPSQLSLRSLRRSKCVAVLVTSARPARVLVTIFSGRRSVRLFGQRLVVFTAAGRQSTCIRVPARAKTFNVRTPLSFAVGYALGARGRSGQRATRPVIRPIALVP